MILTGLEALTLLQLPEDKLSVVEALIPPIQQFIIDYTHNYFLQKNIYRYSSTISFANESPALILDSADYFIEVGFVKDMHICIENSLLNDGIYKIENVESGIITLSGDETVLDEVEGNTILITAVIFPKSLKLAAAKLIEYNLTQGSKGVGSRSLGDFSESYSTDYPASLLQLLAPYKKLSR